jgi:hypothetical protein
VASLDELWLHWQPVLLPNKIVELIQTNPITSLLVSNLLFVTGNSAKRFDAETDSALFHAGICGNSIVNPLCTCCLLAAKYINN